MEEEIGYSVATVVVVRQSIVAILIAHPPWVRTWLSKPSGPTCVHPDRSRYYSGIALRAVNVLITRTLRVTRYTRASHRAHPLVKRLILPIMSGGQSGYLIPVVHGTSITTTSETQVAIVGIVAVITTVLVRKLSHVTLKCIATPPLFFSSFLLIGCLHRSKTRGSLGITVVSKGAVVDVVIACRNDAIMGRPFVRRQC